VLQRIRADDGSGWLGCQWGFGGRLSAVPYGHSRWCLWVVAGVWLAVGSGGRCRWGPVGGVRWMTSPDFELCPWVGVADGGAGCRSLP
jgi:hypothetical protein